MITIYLEIESKQIKQQQKISSKHLWFDVSTKEMIVLSCGSLKFRYDVNNKKMIPYTEEKSITINSKKDNKEQLLGWIKNNKDIVSFNANESSLGIIAVDIEDGDLEFVSRDLDRFGFRYVRSNIER